MDTAKDSHIIPIIRLATEGDYFNTKVWRKPTGEDVLYFANFLSSLTWPTKNKYVIVFKNKDADFFIISAGLDNAAPTTLGMYMNSISFVDQMLAFSKTVFTNVDG